MSKLAKLRSNTTSQAAIFSSNVDAPIASIFARMQGQKTPQATQNNSNRKRYVPSTWRLKKGEKKELVILDAEFTFAMREHTRQNAQGYFEQVRCIADFDSCPVCSLPNNRPYDVVLLTVLDLTPWEKNGVTYEYTKRVLKLKKHDYDSIKIIASMQGLRGVVLEMERGHEKLESSNGKPTFVSKLTEDDLIEAFGVPEKKYDSGFVLPANHTIQPFNYKETFPAPSRAELEQILGVAPRPGSKADLADDSEVPPWEEDTVETLDLSEDLPEFPNVD